MAGVRLKRRTPLEWGVRIAVAAAVAVVGYLASVQSFAESLPDAQTELAHRLAPNDARVTAKLSRIRMLGDPMLAHKADEERLAREALRGDATAISAATTLGFIVQAQGDLAMARRLFAYSDRLSRRDLVTRLWLIEDAVTRGDAVEALRHYDIALRTNSSASEMLFPVLATASNDPVIAAALVRTLATRPAWGNAFLEFSSGKSGDPEATARLFLALRRVGVAVPPVAQASLVNALLEDKFFDTAWTYYASVRKGADRSRSRDPQFAAMLEAPSRLDWVPTAGDTGMSATLQPDDDGGVLVFSVPPSAGGDLIQQMQLLPAGNYALEGHSIDIDQTPASLPYWSLKCATDGRELGRIVVSNSAANGGHFGGRFTVPQGCPVQYLVLVARASETVAGVSGQIDHLQLRPAS